MHISTLNKVVNLFLVGSFLLCTICFFGFEQLLSWVRGDDFKDIAATIPPPLAVLVATMFLLAVTLFSGLLVDSAAGLIRELFRPLQKRKLVANFFLCTRGLDALNLLRDKFDELLGGSDKFTGLKNGQRQNRLFATALFFHTANAQNIDWAIQHYSMHLLARNCALLVLISMVIAACGNSSSAFKLVYVGSGVVVSYLLVHTAIRKNLYTYEVTYRHCCVVLADMNRPSTKEQPVS